MDDLGKHESVEFFNLRKNKFDFFFVRRLFQKFFY